MMRLPLLVLIIGLAACAEESDRPLGGGGSGGGGGGGGGNDGGGPVSDAQARAIRGTLCLVTDLRNPLQCATTSALDGIAIDIAGTTTTSEANGSFAVPAIDDNKALVKIAIGDDGYRDMLTIIALDDGEANEIELPVISDATWQSFLTANGVDDEGASIATYLRRGTLPESGAEIIPPVGTLLAPLYDGPSADPNDWISGGVTGNRGAAILLGVATGDPSTSFDISANADLVSVDNVPVLPGVLTYVPLVLN